MIQTSCWPYTKIDRIYSFVLKFSLEPVQGLIQNSLLYKGFSLWTFCYTINNDWSLTVEVIISHKICHFGFKNFVHVMNCRYISPSFKSFALVASAVWGVHEPYLDKAVQELNMTTTESAKRRLDENGDMLYWEGYFDKVNQKTFKTIESSSPLPIMHPQNWQFM